MAPLNRLWLIMTLLAVALGSGRPCGAQPLPELQRLTGHMATPDGAPIANQNFQIVRTRDDPMAQVFTIEVLTNAKGDFSVPNIEEGSYYVLLGGQRVQARHLMGGYDEGGQKYTVGAAQTHWDIALRLPAGLTLHLSNPDGQPAANEHGQYVLVTDQGMHATEFIADGGGSFQALDVESGNYNGLIVYTASASYASQGAFSLAEDKLPTELTLRLKPGGALRVQALDSVTLPAVDAPDAPPTADARPLGGIPLRLQPADSNPSPLALAQLRMLPGSHNITEDGSGAGEYRNLPPGSYNLVAGDPNSARTTVKRTVTVLPGATTKVTLYFPRVEAPSLAITLLDAHQQPVRNRPVQISIGQNAGARYGHSDEAGLVSLYPVLPGDYRLRVVALDTGDPTAAATGVGMGTVTVTEHDAAITMALNSSGARGAQGFGQGPRGGGQGQRGQGQRGGGQGGFGAGGFGGGQRPQDPEPPAQAVIPNPGVGWTVGVVK